MLSRLGIIALLASALVATPFVKAGDGLGAWVPADVHMFAHGKSNPAVERISAPFEKAFRDLVASGIGEDVFELATMELGSDERDAIRGEIVKVFKLLGKVDWNALVADEVAFGFRLQMPIPEYVFLFRAKEGAAKRQGELRQVLDGIAAYAPDALFVGEAKRHGAKIATLSAEGFPVALSAASKRDVVVISTSDFLLNEVLELMDSESGEGSIVRSKRFTETQADLDKGYGRGYFDLAGYLGFISNAIGMAGGLAQGDPDAQAALKIVKTIFKELAMLQTAAWTERVDGDRVFVDSRLTMKTKDDGAVGFIEKLVADQDPVDDYIRVVPKDAIAFHLASGVRPVTIYDAIIELIGDAPEGERALGRWSKIQEKIGFTCARTCCRGSTAAAGRSACPRRRPAAVRSTSCSCA